MSTLLLTTKHYVPPPQPNQIPRSRLLEKLNEGLETFKNARRKVTLISAPAGFGKTTLVSEWISRTARKTAWLSLEEDDHELSRFLVYLLSALRTVASDIGQGLSDALHSSQSLPIEPVLTILINEIATLSDDLLVVLDDYHLLDSRAVDRALTFLLDHLPPQLHLVIVTREDPNLPLAKLRARGQLTEIRTDDLRFTTAEAAAFLNQMMDLDLSAEEVAALEARTEGWIAGLQLAALSMKGRRAGPRDKANFIKTFTGGHRFIMDYLVEEVLEQQPPHVQSFLLHTSILDRLCGPLCDAVMGSASTPGQQLLEQLEQANLFLVPLDNERRWYRYHPLFAELLRGRLQHQMATPARDKSTTEDGQSNVAEIHRRASIWLEENNLMLDALRHALAASDFARAAALLERTWRVMEDTRQSARWLRWAQKIPDELIRERPVLSAGCGWALLSNGELEAADVRLRDAEHWLEAIDKREHGSPAAILVADENEFQALPATIAAARTYLALALGDLSGTKKYARQTLDLLPVDNHLRRGVPATLLGLAYWADGKVELACRTFADGMASFRMAGNVLFAITGCYILADMKRVQGRLKEAVQIHQRWLRLVAEHGKLIQRGSADIYTGLSELACEQGDLETSSAHLRKSEELGGRSPLPRWRYRWSLAQARLKQAQGELDATLELLDEAEQAYVRGPVPDVRPIAAMKARVWLMQGRLSEAAAWAQDAGLCADDPLSYIREYEHVTLARLLIARHRSEGEERCIVEAMTLLTRLLSAAQKKGRMGSVIEILLLQALSHEAKDDFSSALLPLAHALALAEPEGYVRLFVDEGPPMESLLTEAVAQGIMPDYVAMLLATFASEEQKAARQVRSQVSLAPPPADQPLIEPLSARELEVLELVAQGLSNREICEKLFLSINTVKGHNRRIFEKLQVNRRTEAVARARKLGMV